MINTVVKRDGTKVDFELSRIENAISRAFEATGKETNRQIVGLIALRAAADFGSKVKDGEIGVEAIQDSVETTLALCGYSDVAKNYILYRKQHENVRNAEQNMIDYKKTVLVYLTYRRPLLTLHLRSASSLILELNVSMTSMVEPSQYSTSTSPETHEISRLLTISSMLVPPAL